MSVHAKTWLPEDEPGYENRVQAMAYALHEDCVLEWRGIAAVDPNRQISMHTDRAHYGQAHDLVRRLVKGGRA